MLTWNIYLLLALKRAYTIARHINARAYDRNIARIEMGIDASSKCNHIICIVKFSSRKTTKSTFFYKSISQLIILISSFSINIKYYYMYISIISFQVKLSSKIFKTCYIIFILRKCLIYQKKKLILH